MVIDLGDVLLLCGFLSFLAYWWSAQGVKQQAFRAVKNHCKSMDVQLLDEGVALRGFWLKRDAAGRIRVWRSFVFEFSSTGNERYEGRVMMLGPRIEKIDLQPHRLN